MSGLAAVLGIAIPAAIGVAIWLVRLGPLGRRRGPGAARTIAPVSIIVPARDEAHNLPALLASLARLDPAPKEIIVVDDHSRDGTGDLARAAGARVVVPPPLPPGWNGKPWACHHGAQVATGAYLAFTDADTVHAPDSLGLAVATLEAEQADLLSIVPTHRVVSWWERIQAVVHLLLLVAARPDRFAIGQYLLFRREGYDRIGGHTAAPRAIAEDLALARRIQETGGRTHLLVAPGALDVRMYPEGLGAFVRGWRRNFKDGLPAAGARGFVEVTFIMAWLLGAPIAAFRGALAGEGALLATGLAFTVLAVVEVHRRGRLVGRFPWWSAPCYPIFLVLFVVVTVMAATAKLFRRPVVWKGRTTA